MSQLRTHPQTQTLKTNLNKLKGSTFLKLAFETQAEAEKSSLKRHRTPNKIYKYRGGWTVAELTPLVMSVYRKQAVSLFNEWLELLPNQVKDEKWNGETVVNIPIFDSPGGSAAVHTERGIPLISHPETNGGWGQWSGYETIKAEENKDTLFYSHFDSDVKPGITYAYYYSDGQLIYKITEDHYNKLLVHKRKELITFLIEEIEESVRGNKSFSFPRWWKWNGLYYITAVNVLGFSGNNLLMNDQLESHKWEDCW